MNPIQNTQRFDQLKQWLTHYAHDFQLDFTQMTPVSSDAGIRQYYRLACKYQNHQHIIAVDSPASSANTAFLAIAELLRTAHIHVPQVFAYDLTQGFMLISDLGQETYLSHLQKNPNPTETNTLFREAIDSLIRWQTHSKPNILPVFNQNFIMSELNLMPEWYIEKHLKTNLDNQQQIVLQNTFNLLSESLLSQPQGFTHRDFMVRNLMISQPNPGVIDFQDAVYGPLSYDLISLLRDAFISWDDAFELDCFNYYWENARQQGLPIDSDFSVFYQQLEWTGLQRHIKILGIFSRLNYRDQKPQYLQDLPRFIGYAQRVATKYPALHPFSQLLNQLTE